jgi:AbrB family looped-hinge helix DNA binding protein
MMTSQLAFAGKALISGTVGVILQASYLRRIGPMADAEKLVTIVSTKGQIVLPKAIRRRREWDAGTRLLVEETPEGIMLKRAPVFAETRSADVFASLPTSGKPKSLEEMEAGVLAEARRRHAGD